MNSINILLHIYSLRLYILVVVHEGATQSFDGCSLEADDLRGLMNNMKSAINVKVPAIPANSPVITPAMRRVGASELEVGTSKVGVQKLSMDKCTPEIAIATHLISSYSSTDCLSAKEILMCSRIFPPSHCQTQPN